MHFIIALFLPHQDQVALQQVSSVEYVANGRLPTHVLYMLHSGSEMLLVGGARLIGSGSDWLKEPK